MKAVKPFYNLYSITLIVLFLAFNSCVQIKRTIVDTNQYTNTIKVACVGNSITYGSGIENRDSLSYPAQLGRLLGTKWEVRNFGVGGRTLLMKGDRPYINEQAYIDAKTFLPDLVLIKLGTNDTKPQNWVHKAEFINDYKKLVKSFQEIESHPKIVLLKAVPAFPDRWGISDSIIHFEMNPMVEQIAHELNLPLIDLHTPFINDEAMFPDKIHPNADGAGKMAKIIKEALIGVD